MKKMLLILLVMMMLTGCCISHDWTEADCVTPKTCSKCSETEGEALGHSWAEATCTEAKTCSVCGGAEGGALGHIYADATCVVPMTCTVCGNIPNESLGDHVWGKWNAFGEEMSRTCTLCRESEHAPLDQEVIQHQFIVGSWTGTIVANVTEGTYGNIDIEKKALNQCCFHEDGTFELLNMGNPEYGCWRSLRSVDPISTYQYSLATSYGDKLGFFSADGFGFEEDQLLWWFDLGDQSYWIIYERSEAPVEIDVSSVGGDLLTREDLVGSWKSWYFNNENAVEDIIFFRTDGTFTRAIYTNGTTESSISGVYEVFVDTIFLYENGDKNSWQQFYWDGVAFSDWFTPDRTYNRNR